MSENNLNRALFRACIQHHPGKVRECLEKGANPNAFDPSGHTPLTLVCKSVERVRDWDAFEKSRALQTQCATLLIEGGAQVNLRLCNGSSALHAAVVYGVPDLVDLFLKHGADVDALNDSFQQPLHHLNPFHWPVPEHSLPEAVRIARGLIEHGARVNVRDNCNRLPLLGLAEFPHLLVQVQQAVLEFNTHPVADTGATARPRL